MTRLLIQTLLVFTSAIVPSFGSAQSTYPTKPVKIIVPFLAGGTTDIVGRLVAQELTKAGINAVVENRPGAGGNIGAEQAAKSQPDGYTLFVGTVGTHGINSSLYAKLPYDPIKDFAPITLVASVPNVLIVPPSMPANSVKELIALIKAKPGKYNYASSGNGTSIHLSAELFKSMTGAYITHIPYRGSAAAITDVMSGQVDMMFDNLPTALPHIKSGKLKALGLTSAKQNAAVPGVPTIAEAALPGYEASSWFGMFAPAGTPKEIVAKLHQVLTKALATPEVRERLLSQGAEPVGNTPEQFAEYVKIEIGKWAKVVKASGAKVD
jgi:tripartite-type tricarboxylate transporter receptor subunit TctC